MRTRAFLVLLILISLQLDGGYPAAASAELYAAVFAPQFQLTAVDAHQRAQDGFRTLSAAAGQADAAAFAAARARVWTAILAGGLRSVETALQNNDLAAARLWLSVREFRTATRFSRPGADATLAIEKFSRGGFSEIGCMGASAPTP